ARRPYSDGNLVKGPRAALVGRALLLLVLLLLLLPALRLGAEAGLLRSLLRLRTSAASASAPAARLGLRLLVRRIGDHLALRVNDAHGPGIAAGDAFMRAGREVEARGGSFQHRARNQHRFGLLTDVPDA